MQPEKTEHFNVYSANYSERQNQKKQQQKQEKKHSQYWPELVDESYPQKQTETKQDLQGAALLFCALYKD